MVNVHEAKTTLSKLLQAVERGEEVVIARNGVAVAKLVQVVERPRRRRQAPESWRGKVWISPDIEAFEKEIEALFYEGEVFPPEDE